MIGRISLAYRRVMRSNSLFDMRFGSQMTPPFAPPKGKFTTAVFHVIQAASAFTSSRVTLAWKRMPPFPGPRERLCCTRKPVSTRTWPLSIFVGNETSRTRFGVRSTWRSPGSSFSSSAAMSNWICAMRKGFRSSRGAMRGTRGGTVGFTTVAISFGPFLGTRISSYLESGPNRQNFLPAGISHLRPFAASGSNTGLGIRGAKVQQLIALLQRQGHLFRYVHPANRIPHQLARRFPCVPLSARDIPRAGRLARRSRQKAPHESHTPGNHQEPKQKSQNTSKKGHLYPNYSCRSVKSAWNLPSRVYAMGKAAVKRNSVISMGCAANRAIRAGRASPPISL